MILSKHESSTFFTNALYLAAFTLLAAGLQLIAPTNASAWEIDQPEWYGPTTKSASGAFSPGSGTSDPASWTGPQKVYLDFDTYTTVGEHVYTAGERTSILAGISAIYAPWDFTFTASPAAAPTAPFALLKFNDGVNPGGLASDVDFRNLDLGGSAQIQVVGIILAGASSADFVSITTTIGAHELGHLAGLRHADSYGPIGNGITSPNPGRVPYEPDYPGLITATESGHNTMASPASVGQTIPQALAGTRMGERSAIKLTFNQLGTVSPEIGGAHGTSATAQLLTLPTISVPNTAISGDTYFNKNLFADVEAVTGSITVGTEKDFYKFTGTAGDIINAEAISNVPGRIRTGNPVDPTLTLFRPDGTTVVAQGLGTAYNDDEFESFDSTLIDIVLPVTGTYFVQVGTSPFSGADVLGNYELYLFRFRAEPVPEPAAVSLLMLGVILASSATRRGRRYASNS